MRVSAALLQRMKRDSLRSVRQGVTEAAKPVSTHNTLSATLHYLTLLLLPSRATWSGSLLALQLRRRQHCIVQRQTVTCHYGPTCPNFCVIMPVMVIWIHKPLSQIGSQKLPINSPGPISIYANQIDIRLDLVEKQTLIVFMFHFLL